MIKASDKFQLKDILQNILPLIFKNITVIRNKESLRNCLNQEVQEDMMAKFFFLFYFFMMAKFNVASSMEH